MLIMRVPFATAFSSRGEGGVIIIIVSFVHTLKWKKLEIDFEEK